MGIEKETSSINTNETVNFEQQLAEAQELTNDIKKLIVNSEEALQKVGIKSQLEVLERWMESYRRGLSAANKLCNSGTEIIESFKNNLKLAVEEMHRLEGEGGNTSDKKQAAEIEELLKTSRRFEKLVPSIEQMFNKTFTHEGNDTKN